MMRQKYSKLKDKIRIDMVARSIWLTGYYSHPSLEISTIPIYDKLGQVEYSKRKNVTNFKGLKL